VFIYGTLKTGQPNNFRLQAAINKSQAELIGRATTTDCWPLIVYSDFNIPFMLDCKGTGKASISLSSPLSTFYTKCDWNYLNVVSEKKDASLLQLQAKQE